MRRVGRINPDANKDPKDSEIEKLKKEILNLKQYIYHSDIEKKKLMNEFDDISYKLTTMSDDLEDAEEKLESKND